VSHVRQPWREPTVHGSGCAATDDAQTLVCSSKALEFALGKLCVLAESRRIYLKGYASVPELDARLQAYFRFYNQDRPHQDMDYRKPAEVH
jgi:hypothetical protein